MTASSSSNVVTDDVRTTQYAQDAAYYLQTISADPTLPRVQTLRYRELQEKLPRSERKKVPSPPMCSLCGTLMIPGWTGSMQLPTLKPGRRKRKHEDSIMQETTGTRNRLEWNCKTCGSVTLYARSDPNTKAQFRPVKKHKPIATLLKPPAHTSMKLDTPPTTRPSTPTTQVDTKQKEAKVTNIPPNLSTNKPVVKPVPSWKQPPVPKAATNTPEPAQKKRRTKKEGLQALLQAKKEQEEKEKRAMGGLGLSSFLKGLQ